MGIDLRDKNLTILDEGVDVSSSTSSINFTGSGVSVSSVGDDVTVTIPGGGSTGGVFGISNSLGVYTYYTTLTLAMAAATSGQVIEMFADVIETGAVAVILKNGVNINGNGHTYTLSNSGTINALIDNGVAISCEIYNIKIIRTLGATPSNVSNLCLSVTGTASQIKCNGVFLRNTNGSCCLNQGNLWGVSAISTNGTLGTIFNTGNLYDSYVEHTNNLALYVNSGNVYNCKGIANTSGDGILMSTASANVYNCYGKSLSGLGINATNGKCYHSVATSTTGAAISASSGAELNMCIGVSTSGNGITGNGYLAYQCKFISSSATSVASGTSAEHYDCSHESTSNVAVNGFVGLKLYRGTIYSKWNNVAGHAFTQTTSGSVLNNVFLRVTNATANCIYSASATTINYAQNAFLGATTSVNANITQGITNLEDTQGNQKL